MSAKRISLAELKKQKQDGTLRTQTNWGKVLSQPDQEIERQDNKDLAGQ